MSWNVKNATPNQSRHRMAARTFRIWSRAVLDFSCARRSLSAAIGALKHSATAHAP